MRGPFPHAGLARGGSGVSASFALTWLAVEGCFDEQRETDRCKAEGETDELDADMDRRVRRDGMAWA